MQLTVLFNQNLTPQSKQKSIYHLCLQSSEPLAYQAGDWALVFVQNPPGLVDLIKKKLNLTGQEPIELRKVGGVSVDEALLKHLELTQLNPAVLNKCQRRFNWQVWPDRQAMMTYARGKDILDLLEAFAELTDLGSELLSLLLPLAPRYYSIASSPVTNPKQLELVYRQVVYSAGQRQRYGVASNWLAALTQGETLEIELAANRAFKLPEPTRPIIMIAAGTGIAPFIGFLAERCLSETQNWLFFGETHQATNFLFSEQLESDQQRGCLTLTTAFSRDQAEKIYVQDRLWQNRVAVWDWLQQGANLYICGDKDGMAFAVEQTLKSVIAEQGLDPETTWQDWKVSGRVQLDIY